MSKLSKSTENVFICLSEPGNHLGPRDRHHAPTIILGASIPQKAIGPNGIFIRSGDIEAQRLLTPDQKTDLDKPQNYSFMYFTEAQRRESAASHEQLQKPVNSALKGIETDLSGLVPFTILSESNGIVSLYHLVDVGHQGSLYLCFERLENTKKEVNYQDIDDFLEQANPRLRRCHELLNHDCTFSRWRADLELERKFTFKKVPDTWKLIQDLYQEAISGRVEGFVSEIGLEFQVFDYESHVFEVLEPETEAGYISFIPQSNGKMTVKRKWFTENAELRKETLYGDRDIELPKIADHVATMTTGKVRKLSTFRRKRFDVHIESLKTGHIFGVYFDICRIVGSNKTVMSQCEVEYCRSRTLWDLESVYEEFELISDYVKAFLTDHEVEYQHDLYSKLDFVREHSDRVLEKVGG